MIIALLVDLDGTLIDTAPSLIHSLQILLNRHQRPALPLKVVRPLVGEGSMAMINAAFQPESSNTASQLQNEFLEIYSQQLFYKATVFNDLDNALCQWEARGYPWGVVTNKLTEFARPLLARLGFEKRIATLVCGDTLTERKPSPLPLQYAAGKLGLTHRHCVYLGDDERDIVASRRARMHCLAATYNDLKSHRVEHWGADAIVSDPAKLIDTIDALAQNCDA